MLLVVALIAIAAGLTVAHYYHSMFGGTLSGDHGTWGQFGDYLGGVLNPIFALLALFALLFTIDMQSRELAATTAALRAQNHTLQRQQFETTYFQLLNVYNTVVGSLKIHVGANVEGGKRAFEPMHGELTRRILPKAGAPEYAGDRVAALAHFYDEFYNVYGHLIGHYFRTLYNIIKFVDLNESLSAKEKKSYSNFLRAQLSKYELGLLLYNCMSEHGRGFRKWVVKYHLLKHLEPNAVLAQPTDEKLFYELPESLEVLNANPGVADKVLGKLTNRSWYASEGIKGLSR